MSKNSIIIHTDGAARGNPGQAGAGAVIEVQSSKFLPALPCTRPPGLLPGEVGRESKQAGKVQSCRFKKFLGVATNNQAEYRALICALEEAKKVVKKEHLEDGEILCYSDSELMVRQMKGEYRVKDKDLQTLFLRALELTRTFPRVSFVRIPREKNREADKLANEAIDEHAPIV